MRINILDTRLDENNHPYLIKERGFNYGTEIVTSPKIIAELLKQCFEMDRCTEEYCYMLALNTKGRLLGVFLISRGTVNASLVGVREIFLKALLAGAVHIILTHNHPAGEVVPSTKDHTITRRIKEAGELIGIPLLDHIIVGGNGYYSFKEHEIL